MSYPKKQTKILHVTDIDTDIVKIKEAAMILQNGGVVAFPTETVYGLGADATNPEAIKKIYQAKGRPSDNPLIVHISDISQVPLLAKNIPQETWILAEHFWPGPLTLILKASESISKTVTAGLDTIALRMPDHPVALTILREVNRPIAAPSANLSGRPSPTKGEHVIDDLNGQIEAIIVSEQSRIGIESTVVDLSVQPARILRPGSVSSKELDSLIKIDHSDFSKEDTEIRSPGTKYRHYAPKGDFWKVTGSDQQKIDSIESILQTPSSAKTRVLISRELRDRLSPELRTSEWLVDMGSTDRPEEIVAGFYDYLRLFDSQDIDRIYIEDIPEDITGQAFINRVDKATGGKKI